MFKVGDIIINKYTKEICNIEFFYRSSDQIIGIYIIKQKRISIQSSKDFELYSDYVKHERKEKIKKLCLK